MLFKKWAKDLNKLITKDDVQIANKHMRKCTQSLVIRKAD